MRKRRIAVELFAMMIAVTGVFHGSMNVNAATKKITVDQTYENATKIKGKTKKGCVVKVKIGKKTYQSKVNKKGNYSVKVSKLKLGKKYTMTAYQKKKVYAKKSFYAETKNIKVNAFTENDHIFSDLNNTDRSALRQKHLPAIRSVNDRIYAHLPDDAASFLLFIQRRYLNTGNLHRSQRRK